MVTEYLCVSKILKDEVSVDRRNSRVTVVRKKDGSLRGLRPSTRSEYYDQEP
jgi:hypothetical protein